MALLAELIPEVTQAWTASRIATEGDVVVHEGQEYMAQWWMRNQGPVATQWGPWEANDAIGDPGHLCLESLEFGGYVLSQN